MFNSTLLHQVSLYEKIFSSFWIMAGLFVLSKLFWAVYYEWKENEGGVNYLRYGKEFFKR